MREVLNGQAEIVAFIARVHDVVLYDVYRVPANGSFDSRGTLDHLGVFSEADVARITRWAAQQRRFPRAQEWAPLLRELRAARSKGRAAR